MFNPSRYRILTVGKVKKSWVKEGISLYLKRLPGLTLTELKDSNLQREALTIRSAIKNNEALVTLAEEGKSLSSLLLADELEELGSERLVFVIGGADGLAPEVKASSKFSLSLSPLTFPHEIALLLLIEQLYRAQTISNGAPYHRQ